MLLGRPSGGNLYLRIPALGAASISRVALANLVLSRITDPYARTIKTEWRFNGWHPRRNASRVPSRKGMIWKPGARFRIEFVILVRDSGKTDIYEQQEYSDHRQPNREIATVVGLLFWFY